MRTAPAVAVTIHRSSRWIVFVALLAIAAIAAPLVWVLWGESQLRWLAVAAAAAFSGTVFMGECRRQPVALRWDRQCWHLDLSPFAAMHEEAACELTVAIDLGDWLLLRLTQRGGSRRIHRSWLAIQRSSTDGDWHALRCAVYSPRPPRLAEAGSPAQDSTFPPA